MFVCVDAVVTASTGRFRQQAFALVVPDRLYLSMCGLGQFTDFHGFTLGGGRFTLELIVFKLLTL